METRSGIHLPTRSDVFAHFFYLHKSEKMKLGLAKPVAVGAATVFWEKVAITPKWMDQGVHMLTGIYDEYQAI